MKRRIQVKALQISVGPERYVALGELQKGILFLLGVWLAYFLVINLFLRQLNSVAVPVIGLPLGIFLTIQGAALVFVGALYVLLKRRQA